MKPLLKSCVRAFVITSMLTSVAFAADAPVSQTNPEELKKLLEELKSQKTQVDTQETAIGEQIRKLEMQQRELKAQRLRLNDLQNRVRTVLGEKPEPVEVSTEEVASPQSQAKQTPEEVGTERKPIEKERPPEVAALADEGGVLTKKGTVVIEPSTTYSRSSSLRVAIEGFTIIPALNIGSFDISQVDRDTFTEAVSARVGLTNRLELEARVPYVFRNDSTFARPFGVGSARDELIEVSGDGLGDMEAAAHYQINKGEGGWPFFVANLRFKSRTGTDPFEVPVDATTKLQTELPTGSGFYGVQPSITAIYPSDPVVFFANLGYLYNVKRTINSTLGEIDPGDSVSGSFGMGISLNDKASFSLGYSHDTVFETLQNGNTIPGSDVLQLGTLNVGYAYRLSDRVGLNFSIGTGVTEDAPDTTLTLRVPISLQVF